MYRIEPNLITLFTTDMCNMRCKYCFEENKPINGTIMSFEVAKKSIDLLLKSNNKDKGIDLFGGEPTLNLQLMKDIIKYVEKNKINDIYFKLSTNLYNLNNDILNTIKQYQKVLCRKNFGITVSLDGTKELNDKNRIDINGSGTFDKIMNNIKLLKKEIPNIFISIHCVLTNNNFNKIDEIVDFLISNYNNKLFDDISLAPVTSDTTEEIPEIKDIEKLFEIYYKIKYNNKYDESLIDKLFGHFILYNCFEQECISYCQAGKEQIAVIPNGQILVCHRYIEHPNADYSLGNILDIKDCIEIDTESEYYKKYIAQEWTKDVKNFCGIDCNKCPINHLCHMCVGGNELANKDISINSEEKCERSLRIAEVQTKMKLERIQEENNVILNKIQETLNLMLQGQIRMAELLLGNNDITDNME